VFDLINALLRPKGLAAEADLAESQTRLAFVDSERLSVYVLQVMSILCEQPLRNGWGFSRAATPTPASSPIWRVSTPRPGPMCDREADHRQAWAEFERRLRRNTPASEPL
jgi:hypothetical protein